MNERKILIMNKNDIIRATKDIVSQELEGVTLKDTTVFVEATLKAIENALVKGEKVSFVGFGNFETAERAERTGRNPKTGEEILIPASKAVKFKPSSALKAVVNA